MKAAVLREFGSVPRCEEYPDPVPGAGQLLVQVKAVALENIDKAQASGKHYSSKAHFTSLPAIVGGDGVGVIDGKTVAFGGCTAPYGAMADKTLGSAANGAGSAPGGSALKYAKQTTQDDERRREVSASGGEAADAVESALAEAIRGATTGKRWDVVAQLAKELEARLARSANVVALRGHHGAKRAR
jgi:NADPH:quinone reductase-like Zn-dependent oxidoreductase